MKEWEIAVYYKTISKEKGPSNQFIFLKMFDLVEERNFYLR
jgi:hypothetical protein